jgi:asparagine synthase (glutamine-hydrolysing)
MTSSCGRIVIVYNGELYNTAELRSDLEAVGRKFRGSSDTEVIVEGFAEYGIENFVRRLDGIFAFGAYDFKSKTLWLGRDHLGVKPLFYGQFEGLTIFGSEIKALTAHPDWNKRINVSVIAEYLNRDYIPAPDSIYEGVFKLMPGSLVRIDHNGSKKDIGYWALEDVIEKSRKNQFEDINDASNALSKLLVETVDRQMVSDVPLGGLLSGGIDSSLIVALMQQATSRPVETFSLGFLESEHNEAPQASRVAEYLGTNHHEVYVTPDQMLPLVYEMPNIYDEPFADSSQLPTYLITRLASQHVKVALSGDGGDELFGG